MGPALGGVGSLVRQLGVTSRVRAWKSGGSVSRWEYGVHQVHSLTLLMVGRLGWRIQNAMAKAR
jgi:hypothetical protein